MKACKSCQIEKPLTEYYKNSRGHAHRSYCKICCSLKACARLKANPPTKEARRLSQAKFRKNNPQYNALQLKKGRDKAPHKQRARNAYHKAAKKQATPIWLTKEQKAQIMAIYASCPADFHVDHIIPINGKNVKGFHVPWNLQHLPALDNIKKNNKIIQGNQ